MYPVCIDERECLFIYIKGHSFLQQENKSAFRARRSHFARMNLITRSRKIPRTSAHFLDFSNKRKMFRNSSFNSNSSSISMLSTLLGDEVLDVDRDGYDYNLDFRREYRPNAMKNVSMMGDDIRRQQRQQCEVEHHSFLSSKKAVTLKPQVSMARRGNVINKRHRFGVEADRGIHDSFIDAPNDLSINDYMENDSLISANSCCLPTSISRDIFEKPVKTMVKKVVSSSSCSNASSDGIEDDDMPGCIERVASSSERAPSEIKGALYTNLTPIPLQNSIGKPFPSLWLNRTTSKDLLAIRQKDPPTPHMVTSSKGLRETNLPKHRQRQPRLVQHHSYHDFANIKPSKMDSAYIARHVLYSSSSGTTRKHKLPFLLKLHRMLDEATIAHLHEVISWQPHGRAFIVHRPDQISQLLDLYFDGSKYSSFQRNLNIYGFRRITKGPDAGAYYHQMFIRHKYHLCSRMTRTPVKGTVRFH